MTHIALFSSLKAGLFTLEKLRRISKSVISTMKINKREFIHPTEVEALLKIEHLLPGRKGSVDAELEKHTLPSEIW